MDNQQIETIGSYVKDHLPEWLEEARPSPGGKQMDLAERIVRVKEILPRQTDKINRNREALDQGAYRGGHAESEMIKPQAEMLNQRIEDMIRHSEKRFSHHQHAGYRLQVLGDNALNRCSGGAVKGLPG